MKKGLFLVLTVLVITVLSISGFAQAQDSTAKGTIVAPPSSRGLPGLNVRTPLYIFKPDVVEPANSYPGNAETAGSIACIYGVTPPTSGCPKNGSPLATGGTKAIALVDYGHNSTLHADFDLSTPTSACRPRLCNLSAPAAHVRAPTEAAGTWRKLSTWSGPTPWRPTRRLLCRSFAPTHLPSIPGAETLAGQAVAALGGGEVSNSFGYGGEFNGELNNDQYMTQATVVYFASAGDSGLGADYPSVSPNVVSAGGTHIVRSGGNLLAKKIAGAVAVAASAHTRPYPTTNSSSATARTAPRHAGLGSRCRSEHRSRGLQHDGMRRLVSGWWNQRLLAGTGGHHQCGWQLRQPHRVGTLQDLQLVPEPRRSTTRTSMTSPRQQRWQIVQPAGTSAPVLALRETWPDSKTTAFSSRRAPAARLFAGLSSAEP